MAKRPAEKYYPGNIPDTLPALIQFLYDEFWRISEAISAFPVGLNVIELEPSVPVDTTPVEFRLFEGEAFILDLPGGGWDQVLGEWTAPVSGLYQINMNSIIEPFGSGNKDYAAKLRLYIDNVERWANSAVGDDAFSLSCSLAVSGYIARESIVRATIELVHEQFTGTSQVNSFIGISSTAKE